MKISVITPFYEGDDYMKKYIDCMYANDKVLTEAGHELEVILVNDSPWKRLEASPNTIVKVITHDENRGIHQSRVDGLKVATGDYVMFLDQDDLIKDDGLLLMLKNAKKHPDRMIVANALLQQADGSELQWYRTNYHKAMVKDLKTYLTVGIQIISPGQCLIPRNMIPDFWCDHILQQNGADDYFLWILMLAAGSKFHIFNEDIYIHVYTAKNLSADTTVTDASTYGFIELLKDYPLIKARQIKTLKTMMEYKATFRKKGKFGKITCSLKHPVLLYENVVYKYRTKTPLGFNR